MAIKFLYLGLLAITLSVAVASDSNSLQDFCVADLKSSGKTITIH